MSLRVLKKSPVLFEKFIRMYSASQNRKNGKMNPMMTPTRICALAVSDMVLRHSFICFAFACVELSKLCA